MTNSYPRIESNLSNHDYHAMPEISKSGLDLIAKSPAHFKAGYSGIGADEAIFGTAFHSLILEDGKDVIGAPNRQRRSKADKEFYKEFFAQHGATGIVEQYAAGDWYHQVELQTGKSVISTENFRVLEQMADNLRKNDEAVELLSAGKSEQSIFAEHRGVGCRARPDHINDKTLIDLKTVAGYQEWSFASSCARYRYHVQDAMYSFLYAECVDIIPDFKFIVSDKLPPYQTTVISLSDRAKENGLYLFERDLDIYKQCLENDMWPGPPNNLELDIPIYEPDLWEEQFK